MKTLTIEFDETKFTDATDAGLLTAFQDALTDGGDLPAGQYNLSIGDAVEAVNLG